MNPAVTAVGGSTIRALHARRSASSIDLGLGEPTLSPELRHFEAATRWVGEHGCRYSTNIGDEDLRLAIARHFDYPNLNGAGNVCITTGSQEAVYIAMKAILDPAQDEVLLVEPAFPVYAKIAQIEGISLRRVAMSASDGFRFDASRILAAIGPRTRLIILCSPCNPTGRVIDAATVETVANALSARSGPPIYVMHDEIYRELVYIEDAGEFARCYPHTIAINSLSKSNALTGLRLGWVIAPPEAMTEIVKVHGWTTSCASTFAQRVAFEILEAGELGVQRDWYARQRAGVLEAVRATGLRFIEPEGAFYLCVEVGVPDTLAFCHQLIDERDVVAIPGSIFASAFEGWLRTSFVGPLEGIREGLRRIAEAVPALTKT